MSKAIVLQVLGFAAFVAAVMAAALYFSPAGRAPAASTVPAVAAVPSSTPPGRGAEQPRAAGQQDATRGAPLRYAQLPPTSLPPLTVVRAGKPLPLAGARDKPLLLHLWATWCGPCRAELPAILALGRRGEVEVIAVSVDDHFELIQRFFDGKIPPEVAWDPKVTLEPALGVRTLPTTFLVDRQGRARMRWNGLQDWASVAMSELIANELGRALAP